MNSCLLKIYSLSMILHHNLIYFFHLKYIRTNAFYIRGKYKTVYQELKIQNKDQKYQIAERK